MAVSKETTDPVSNLPVFLRHHVQAYRLDGSLVDWCANAEGGWSLDFAPAAGDDLTTTLLPFVRRVRGRLVSQPAPANRYPLASISSRLRVVVPPTLVTLHRDVLVALGVLLLAYVGWRWFPRGAGGGL